MESATPTLVHGIDPGKLYTVQCAADVLGINVRKLYRLIAKGRIVRNVFGRFAGEELIRYAGFTMPDTPATETLAERNARHNAAMERVRKNLHGGNGHGRLNARAKAG